MSSEENVKERRPTSDPSLPKPLPTPDGPYRPHASFPSSSLHPTLIEGTGVRLPCLQSLGTVPMALVVKDKSRRGRLRALCLWERSWQGLCTRLCALEGEGGVVRRLEIGGFVDERGYFVHQVVRRLTDDRA